MTIEEQFDSLVAAGENVFLTGAGGTGKTTLTRRMIARDPGRFAVTASTGIAALNAGGFTLHRWSGMMLGPRDGESNDNYLNDLMNDPRRSVRKGFARIRSCQSLVIDEISMLNGRTLDFLDFMCRELRGSDSPFGGIQVIATGDFLQLPPVNKTGNYDWAFQSRAWQEANFRTVQLTEVKRQDDVEFVRSLSEFRFGVIGTTSANLLRTRIARFPDADLTRLFTHNAQVDKWNAYRLGEIEAEPTVFDAELTGPESQQQVLINNLLTPRELVLKPGAHVMFTVNSSEGGFVNGQTGVVTDLGSRRILVESNGRLSQVEPFTWQFDSKDKTSATFTQFPLRLSWALTIHKAQGLTLDSALIDVRAAREPGQAYVAASRLRTLAGLHLKGWFTGVFVSRAAVDFYLHSK
ncbi:MAG: AAA family ATPase [Verrucomicrobiota bacterium]